VEVVGTHRVRFQLTQPWPDFLAFYAVPYEEMRGQE
jgi:hypothetical protein